MSKDEGSSKASDGAANAAAPKESSDCACCQPAAQPSAPVESGRSSPDKQPTHSAISVVEEKPAACCSRPDCNGEKEPGAACCDDSCLDNIALRECRDECGGSCERAEGKTSRPSSDASTACEFHTRSARQKYAETLEALGCICRALLARNLESCCSPQAEGLRQRKHRKPSRAPSIASQKSDCCAAGACGGGAPKAIVTGRESRGSLSSTSNSCKDGCCGLDKKTVAKKASQDSKLGSGKSCKDGCCGTSNGKAAIDKSPAPSLKDSCKDGCCGSKNQKINAVEKTAVKTASPGPNVGKAGGCVTGCCGSGNAAIETSARSSRTSLADGSNPGCCEPKVSKLVKKRSCGSEIKRSSCGDGCCGPAEKEPPRASCESIAGDSSCGGGCCSSPPAAAPPPPSNRGGCSGDGCCGDNRVKPEPIPALDGRGAGLDPEKGPAALEHVVLSVSGMTCTGCETKLSRTLNALPYVKNVKTSLALSRAEIDIHAGATSVADVVRHVERTTEFQCRVMTLKGAEIHVVPIGYGAKDFTNKMVPPTGVIEMDPVDNQIVRIVYDPDVIGGRDLMEKELSGVARLAEPMPDPSLSAGSKHVRHVGLMTILSAILTIPVLVLAWAPLPDKPVVYGAVSLGLATIIQVLIAGPFYSAALKALVFNRIIEMDLLIVLSTSAAYIFSVISYAYIVKGHPLSTGQFFETSTLLISLIMLGRFLSALARQKAVESISITGLQATTALLVSDEKGTDAREIDARLLQYGDIFKVIPDSAIPTDGTVISGVSEVDESTITGESTPVEKRPAAKVVAGSVNGSGTLIVRLIRLPGNNTISAIADMVAEARFSKPKSQALADRVASYFVPVVVTLMIITFVVWIGVGVGIRKQTASTAATQAITYAIAVLIVSCPCAIGLAVPMVIVMASGVAAQHGVTFKSGEILDSARKLTHVVFDKTGTLTYGNPTLATERFLPGNSQAETFSILLGLVNNIKHPVSRAISEYLESSGVLPSASLKEVRAVPGQGVTGIVDGKQIRAGNSRWLQCENEPSVRELLAKNYTVVCFSIDDELCAIFGLEDSIRPETASTVAELKRRGINVSIVSGDDEAAVNAIASTLDIDPVNVKSKQTPEDKQRYVKDLNSKGIVMFCGDGTNDAAALAQAAIGVHMSGGTDVARSAADVVLVCPSLEGLLVLVDMSKDSHRRIVFNFAWSFVYNLFAILLAAGAFVRARIPPAFAGLGEIVSVLPVIIVAAHIRLAKFGAKKNGN